MLSLIEHHLCQPEPNSGCWLWAGAHGINGHGYMHYAGKAVPVHRRAWEIERGPIPNGLWVLHKCNNARCCNPDHLYLGTHQDNMRDMKESGRRLGKLTGMSSPASKLTTLDVLTIRAVRAWGFQRKHLAASYRVSKQNIADIENRKIWRHV